LTAILQLRQASRTWPASRKTEAAKPRSSPAVAPCGPGGCCVRQPLRTAPPGRGVVNREPSSFTYLWRPLSRPVSARPKPSICGEPGPISPPARQSWCLLRARAPSIDECSLSRARHRAHGFAAANRLPTRFRSYTPRRVSPSGLGARPLLVGRGPSVARRLLQSKQSVSTRRRSGDPRPRPGRLPFPTRSE
jgi:hypothetical protein